MSTTPFRPIAVFVAAVVLAGCATSGTAASPPLSEETRCQQAGGAWRTNFCERGSGGGY